MCTKIAMVIYGTRPEVIKLAPLVKAIKEDSRFTAVTVSTGQHRELLDQATKVFGLSSDHDLGLMEPGQSLNVIVGKVIVGIDRVIGVEKPDVIIVQGDTSTAMAAALAGFHRGVPVVHLEAGLRTGNLNSPFPEEANRRLIAQIASLHLAPTQAAAQNLIRENIPRDRIVITGNTIIDALLDVAERGGRFENAELEGVVGSGHEYVVVTTHRRENLQRLGGIGEAVRRLAIANPTTTFVLPLHLNPQVRKGISASVSDLGNVLVTDPLPYDQFIRLLRGASVVLTDSGGVQEEAPVLGIPVLVLRDSTERVMAVKAGGVAVVGTNCERIVAETQKLLECGRVGQVLAGKASPYGDGHATERALAAIAGMVAQGE